MTDTIEDLVGLVEAQASERSGEVAYVHLERGELANERLTYAELDRRARSFAAFLQERVDPGSRVLLVFPNDIGFLIAFFGCQYAGMIAVPVAPPRSRHAFARLCHIARAAGAEIILTPLTLRAELERRFAVDAQPEGLTWIIADDVPEGLEHGWRRPRPAGDDIAVLQFTSGSTGNPKGVSVTHRNILHNCGLLRSACGTSPDLKLVAWLPNFHDWGLVGCLIFPLFVGRPSYFFDPADFLYRPMRWLQAISKFRGTVACAPNFAYDMCRRSVSEDQLAGLDLSCLEMAMVGAEPVRKDMIETFSATFAPFGFRKEAFFPCFGLAESTLIVSGSSRMTPPLYARIDRIEAERRRAIVVDETKEGRDLVGCGSPLLDQRAMIVDPDTTKPCPPLEIGEIWVAGASVAKGYWGAPDLSEEIFGASPATAPGERWLRTGDLGFMWKDALFVCGRLKDVIIKGGVNYFAEDIEYTVARSHAWLRANSCAAFSVDAQGAERLVVVQEIDFGRKGDMASVIGAIQAAVAKEHEVMADAIAVIKPGTLEKTGSGKLRRQLTKSLFLAEQLSTLAMWKCW